MFKLIHQDEKKIIVKIPPVRVGMFEADMLFIYPDGMELKGEMTTIKVTKSNHVNIGSKKRLKGQTFKDFLIMNGALEEIFGLQRHKECDCNGA